MKMSDHSYACNSLTNFDEEGYTMTGNGSHVTILKNGGLPDDTEEGEMASALLGGVGVLVFTCWPVEVEFG